MISFGFAITKAFEYLHQTNPDHAPMLGARTVGLMMITIGVVSLVLATYRHLLSIKRLRQDRPDLPVSLSGLMSVGLSLLGLFGLIAAILRQ
jgi:uncharacterized membrane protein YidH (DUF202 family)